MEPSDMELLRDYARRGVEKAFTTVVARHLKLVYQSALRQTRRPELAEEITQTVFTLLAQKAAGLSSGTVVAGWLVKTTRFVSVRALRDETRRRRREAEASGMEYDTGGSTLSDGMEAVLPILDRTLADLRSVDRAALVLRYLEGKSFGQVADALGSSEDAAKKRVQRALDRLRNLLGGRGVAIGSVALAAGLGVTCAQALPVGLVPTRIGAAAIGQASGATMVSPLTRISTNAINLTRLTYAVVIMGAIIIAARTGSVLAHRSRPDPVTTVRSPAPSTMASPSPRLDSKKAMAPFGYATRQISVRVIDEDGAPISTAAVQFGGMIEAFTTGVAGRARGNRIGLLVRGMEEIYRADASGVIKLELPQDQLEETKAERIVVPVQAPGYVFAEAKIALANPAPIVLERGKTLTIKVHDVSGAPARPYVIIDTFQSDKRGAFEYSLTWTRPSPELLETHLPKEDYVIMGVSLADGPTFSRPHIFRSDGIGTQAFELQTVPGRHVYGKLDSSVPRPVFGGRVIACVLAPSVEDPEVKAMWQTSGDIAADGTFDLGQVPEGAVNLCAYCQGYVSLPDLGRSVVLVTQQAFRSGSAMPLVVRMIEDGSLKVTVRNASGNPVANALVMLPINQNLDGFSAWNYQNAGGDMDAILPNREDISIGKSPFGSDYSERYQGATDAQGVVTFDHLPICLTSINAHSSDGGGDSRENFQVQSGENAVDMVLRAKPR